MEIKKKNEVSGKWEKCKLEDIFEIARGGSPRPIESFITNDENGINWIMIGDTKDGGKYIERTAKKIKVEGAAHSRFVKEGDFLLTNSMSFGRPYILKTSGCIHDGWLVLSPKNKNIDSDYFYHYLGSDEIKAKLTSKAAGAVVKNLNKEIVSQLEITLPPLATQQRIAAILDAADALRRKDHELLRKYDELAQAIFIDMFGDPVKNEKGWEMKKLGEVCDRITDGTHFSPKNIKQGIPYITAKHVRLNMIDFDGNPTYISAKDHDEIYSRCDPREGDVLYIKDGATTGIAAVNEFKFEFSMLSSLALLRPNRIILNSYFLSFYLNNDSVKSDLLLKYMSGAAIKRFTLDKINKFQIPIPPINLQNEFQEKWLNIRRINSNYSLKHSDSLFHSLLQQAFSGELVS